MECSEIKTSISGIKAMRQRFRKKVREMEQQRRIRQNQVLVAINYAYEVKLMKVPPEILNKPIKELNLEDLKYFEDDEMSTDVRSSNMRETEVKRNNKGRRATKQTRASTRKTVDQYQTPLNSRPTPNAGMVTPKFNPDVPLSVVRKPKEGEMAMSMSGSPLHVTNVMHESKANIVVPLQDGKVLSVLPQRGLRKSQIPAIEQNVKQQLVVLRENLTALLSQI